MVNYTRKIGFLELGSTSIKFYVVSPTGEVDHEEKIPWDLGFDVFEHGRIGPRSIAFLLETLRKLQAEFPEVGLENVTAVGTSALREAQNVDLFRRVLHEELGVTIHIIEGGIEAFLLETGFRSMIEDFPTGLFDLGGGSLELIEYLSESSTRKTSVPIGAIRLHCQVRRSRDMFDYIREARRIVERTLRDYVGELDSYSYLIGTGGTVRAIASCLEREEFTVEDLQSLIQREVRGPIWDHLQAHRRKLFLPGILAVEGLFTTLGVQRIVHRKASVKRGLISLSSTLASSA